MNIQLWLLKKKLVKFGTFSESYHGYCLKKIFQSWPFIVNLCKPINMLAVRHGYYKLLIHLERFLWHKPCMVHVRERKISKLLIKDKRRCVHVAILEAESVNKREFISYKLNCWLTDGLPDWWHHAQTLQWNDGKAGVYNRKHSVKRQITTHWLFGFRF